MIKIDNYSYSYKNKKALNNISMKFEKGHLYGILGPNSSGKTTLFESIAGRYAGYGKLEVDGKTNPKEINDIVSRYSFTNDRKNAYRNGIPFTVYVKFKKGKKINFDGFNEKIYKKYKDKMNLNVSRYNLNTNMASMILCNLLYTMSVDREYYILDEPFNGLDFSHRNVLLDMILERVNEGKTVIVSSHNADILDTVCDIYYFIDKGHVIKEIDSIDKEESIKELYVNTFKGGVSNA